MSVDYVTTLQENVAYVLPLGAPIPSELAGIEVATGNVLQRLLPLSVTDPDGDVMVPIEGAELHACDRLFRKFAVRPNVIVITGLPGAKYDVMFSQAVRQLGLKSMDWYQLEVALGDASRTLQRTKDTRPDLLPDGGLSATQSKGMIQASPVAVMNPGAGLVTKLGGPSDATPPDDDEEFQA